MESPEAQQAMEQFDQAVRLLQSPDTSPALQAQAISFLDGVKTSPTGWVACAQRFLVGNFEFEGTKFQCLVVIEDAIRSKYPDMDPGHKRTIKQLFVTWLSGLSPAQPEPAYILNKMAQLLSLVFVNEFLTEWPSFFTDLISLVPTGGVVVLDVIFRVLTAIHELVVDREMQLLHSADELARNGHIKDAMRSHAVAAIADAWYYCLCTFAVDSPDTCVSCLKTMGQYISWIDINLVVNDRFIPLLFEFAQSSIPLRADSCLCLRSIVMKGTDPNTKTKLIAQLNLISVVGDLFQAMRAEDDFEYCEALGLLCNSIGFELIVSARDFATKIPGGDPTETINLLENCLSLICAVLGNEFDEISQQVLPFVREYLQFCKDSVKAGGPMLAGRRQNVARILETVLAKLRYDNEFNHDSKNDDDQIAFLEFRRDLEIVFYNIDQLDKPLFLEVTTGYASTILAAIPTSQLHVNDVELALHIVWLVGSSKQNAVSDRMTTLMGLVTNGSVAMFNHPIVSLKFLEVCVRMGRFFKAQPGCLPVVLNAFIGEAGINNPDGHVRSRASYWFLRFVKDAVKVQGRDLLQPYMGDILGALQPVCMSEPGTFSEEDQLFLFESLGYLVTSMAQPQDQHANMDALVQPLLERFTAIGLAMPQATSIEQQEQCTSSMKHIIQMITAVSKGFIKPSHLMASQCNTVFEQALVNFMQALSLQFDMEPVRNGVRTYLHRLIVCMGEGILPIMPQALASMLDVTTCQIHDLKEFVPLINQIIDKFKAKVEPMLNEIFMPVVQATYANLNQSVDPNDMDTLNELRILRRCYYEFLSCLITNSLTGVLTSPANAPHSDQVLATIIGGAADPSDIKAQKVCFSMLADLAKVWFGKPGVGVAGFDELVIAQVVPTCFQSILKVDFDPDDAWSYLVLGQIAECLILVFNIAGLALVQFLEQQYFPSMSLPQDTAGTVLAVIQTKDKKQVTQVLKQLSRTVARPR
jgi:exportin-T